MKRFALVGISVLGWVLAVGRGAPAFKWSGFYPSPKAPEPAVVTKPGQRTVYFPGTEELAPDEMHIVACGTGNPVPRLKQAAACFLVQLGNGDNFVFDLGAGSAERLASLDVPYDKLDKVFIGHLHLDHVGDLPAFYFTRSVNQGIANRDVATFQIIRPAAADCPNCRHECVNESRQAQGNVISTTRSADGGGGDEDGAERTASRGGRS